MPVAIVKLVTADPDKVLSDPECKESLVRESVDYIRAVKQMLLNEYRKRGIDRETDVTRFIEQVLTDKVAPDCLTHTCGPDCPHWWTLCANA